MDYNRITSAVTKTAVILVFWFVFLFSLLLEPELTLKVIVIDVVKGLIVSGLAWIFLGIIFDTFIKSIVASAKENKADRFEGGFSYHFIEPAKEEKAWLEANENPDAQSPDTQSPANLKKGKKSKSDKK